VAAWWNSMNQCLDILFKPKAVFSGLWDSADLRPAGMALGITSILLSISTVAAEMNQIPLAEKPLWDITGFRWFQAGAMPVILALGCLISAAVCVGMGRIFRNCLGFKNLLAVVAPALLVPLWPMLWPTDLAISLGLLDTSMAGFPGFWTRELAPALTVVYMLILLWMALGQMRNLLLRESFALAVMSLLPTLGWWALILR
jgi:hypothetical protein